MAPAHNWKQTEVSKTPPLLTVARQYAAAPKSEWKPAAATRKEEAAQADC